MNYLSMLSTIPETAAEIGVDDGQILQSMALTTKNLVGLPTYLEVIRHCMGNLPERFPYEIQMAYMGFLTDAILQGATVSTVAIAYVVQSRRRNVNLRQNPFEPNSPEMPHPAELVVAEETFRALSKQIGRDVGVGPTLSALPALDDYPWLGHPALDLELYKIGYGALIGDGQQMKAEVFEIAERDFLDVKRDASGNVQEVNVRSAFLLPEPTRRRASS